MNHILSQFLIAGLIHASKMQILNKSLPAKYSFDTYLFDQTSSDCECDEETACVRKCCALNYFWSEKSCTFHAGTQFDTAVYIGDQNVTTSKRCYIWGKFQCAGEGFYFRLEPYNYSADVFYPQYDGRLWLPSTNKHFPASGYCLDYFEDNRISALVCEDAMLKTEARINSVGMMVSLPFLLATFVVYMLLPNKNLHAMSLMCYAISLFGAYLCLVLAKEVSGIAGPSCVVLATSCLYFFMSSFLWMNLFSFTIWRSFGKLSSGNAARNTSNYMLLYGLYTWGGALLFVAAITIIDRLTPPGQWYTPGLGDGQCWFTPGYPSLLYFYGPLSIITLADVVFFTQTAWRIKNLQREIAILKKNGNAISGRNREQQTFYLYLKFFVIMGINWMTEIISWIINWQVEAVPSAVWILTDLINALSGVFIFFIYAYKTCTWKLLLRRFRYSSPAKVNVRCRYKNHTTTTTTTTTVAIISITKTVSDE
ncbi:hypothetical protein PPYR_00773 [Photinus pyralis]|uniref:G-protein coupled receptors family 2 profile 2 domain-containing protein n=1 Tax=Photinus pyralis TaxID=7054 RepID=A0A5N4B2M4_PHOPY|nr:hypothetical protein PPYR_00773 [Photinus pyralis]